MSKKKGPTLVSEVMSDIVEVLQVGDTLDRAEFLMRAGHIRHLPVIDGDEHLIGLVTHRDILAAWVSHGDPTHERPHAVAREIPVEMVMQKSVLTTWPEARAAEAAHLLEDNRLGCLPVIDNDKVVGIITEADFVKLAVRYLERDDAA